MPRTAVRQPTAPPAGISPAKMRLIFVARRQLALPEEDYRSILGLYAGVESTKDLDQAGFTAVMTRLEQLGFRSTSKRRPTPARQGMASPGQTSLIRLLWAECTEGKGTDVSLGKWLEKHFHVSSIMFVTAHLAPKVIGALKGMKANLDRAREKTRASATPQEPT